MRRGQPTAQAGGVQGEHRSKGRGKRGSGVTSERLWDSPITQRAVWVGGCSSACLHARQGIPKPSLAIPKQSHPTQHGPRPADSPSARNVAPQQLPKDDVPCSIRHAPPVRRVAVRDAYSNHRHRQLMPARQLAEHCSSDDNDSPVDAYATVCLQVEHVVA